MHNKGLYVYNLALIYAFYSLLDLIHSHCQTGKWTYHGAKKAWGDKDRDLFELTYEVTYAPYVLNAVTGETGTAKCSSTDALVSRDRQSKFETFNVKLK